MTKLERNGRRQRAKLVVITNCLRSFVKSIFGHETKMKFKGHSALAVEHVKGEIPIRCRGVGNAFKAGLTGALGRTPAIISVGGALSFAELDSARSLYHYGTIANKKHRNSQTDSS